MVSREKIKCMTGIIQCERENKGSRENFKGTNVKEEIQKAKVENKKGAESAKEENKMHDGEIDM